MNLQTKPFYLDDAASEWVQSTLDGMSQEEKIGQLFCVIYREGTQQEVDENHAVLSPGGCMYRAMPLGNAVKLSAMLRSRSRIPLLVAANLEKGGNGVAFEGTLFASPMEIAATGDKTMAEKLAIVCAREGKAAGVNWSFAPIIDLDKNFRNPITNTRTFGSDYKLVSTMGTSYIKTIQSAGIAASIKHFPGDGVDERDQHLLTSVNTCSTKEWDATFGQVYTACIEADVMTCMIGHIMLPEYSKHFIPGMLDENIMPASLSPELLNGLLRGKLGFNGLIVTDATTMAGFTTTMPRRSAVPSAIAAGCDMFLFTRNLEEDYNFMKDGVRNDIITDQRLDEAVTRILALKAALGLHKEQEELDFEVAKTIVGCAEHHIWARECADNAITLVKEEKGVLPISIHGHRRVLFYPLESSGGVSQYTVKEGVCQSIADRMRAEGMEVTVFQPPQGNEGNAPPTTDVTENFDLIIYVANLATKSNQTSVRIEWEQPMGANCPNYVNDVPTIFVSVENPYHLLDVPRVKTFINTYSSHNEALDALVDKLMGRSAFTGTSPVDAFCGKWDTHIC